MSMTFKQFLLEGGAATSDEQTQRATQKDMQVALKFVEKHTGIPYDQLVTNLLGSSGHTLAGKKKDSGDIDIAIEEGRYNRKDLVEKMRQATGMDKVQVTGGSAYSFAVPVGSGKKVQVDFMFTPSEKWARFGYHSALDSKHKGVARNMLLVNVMKHIYELGKDITVKDDEGNEVVRVRRGFKMDAGLERLFRVAPMRKDGKGRVALRKGTPEEVEAELKKLGRTDKFAKDADTITNPDKAAEFMFGKGVTANDILSTEGVIKQIFKLDDHAAIFKDAIEDLEKLELPIPDEIKRFA